VWGFAELPLVTNAIGRAGMLPAASVSRVNEVDGVNTKGNRRALTPEDRLPRRHERLTALMASGQRYWDHTSITGQAAVLGVRRDWFRAILGFLTFQSPQP
jgi:hypothetical protein